MAATQSGGERDRGAGRRLWGLFWKRQARLWHWMSGAICFAALLLFAVTGITLNHAHQIKSTPQISQLSSTLPADLLAALEDGPDSGTTASLPAPIIRWLSRELGIRTGSRNAEWTNVDVYVGLPRPGGDAWMSIDRASGEVTYEHTSRGVIAYLNDLHKGRNTGAVWYWFIDIAGVACIIFALTGLWLLQIHAGNRRWTWPLTLMGVAIPAIIAILLIH